MLLATCFSHATAFRICNFILLPHHENPVGPDFGKIGLRKFKCSSLSLYSSMILRCFSLPLLIALVLRVSACMPFSDP